MNRSLHLSKLFELNTFTRLKGVVMAGRAAIENIKRNSDQAKEILQELKSEVAQPMWILDL